MNHIELVLHRLVETTDDVFTNLNDIRSGKRSGVFLTNDVTANYFNYVNKSSRLIQYTRNIVRLQNPVFYMRKNSFLTRLFNEKIEQCKESGLVNHWLAKYAHKPMKTKQIEPNQLGIANILAILQISAVMCVISFIVFLLEVFCPPHGFVRKVLDFLTY